MLTRNVIDFADRDSVWVRALYDAEVRMLDDRVFVPLRALLEETGLRENTIVIVAADHGEGLLDRGVVGHVSTFKEGQLYDEIIRIPMLSLVALYLAGRARVRRSRAEHRYHANAAGFAFADAPPRAQGQSLLPLIRGQDGWQPKLLFETSASGYTADAADYQKRYRAMRTRDWKLIHSVTEQYELYDLNDDPHEEDNVWEEGTALSDSLGRMLNEWAIYAHQVAYRPDMGGDADCGVSCYHRGSSCNCFSGQRRHAAVQGRGSRDSVCRGAVLRRPTMPSSTRWAKGPITWLGSLLSRPTNPFTAPFRSVFGIRWSCIIRGSLGFIARITPAKERVGHF